jgi:hypothetical protein
MAGARRRNRGTLSGARNVGLAPRLDRVLEMADGWLSNGR